MNMQAQQTMDEDYNLSNPVDSFVAVVRRAAFEPARFFASIPRRGNILNPLVFALIAIEVSTILGGLLDVAGVWPYQQGLIRWVEDGHQTLPGLIASVLAAPIGGTIGLFLLAGIVHLLVMLLIGGNAGFEATFRVAAYTSVTQLVSWIPVIGGLLGLYGLYLAIVGIREMHGTTTGRAVAVVLLPFGIFLLVLALAAIGLIVAVIGSGQ